VESVAGFTWNQWQLCRGIRILTHRDLRGADLSNTLFPKADLRDANLKGGADLERAQLQGAFLGYAQLQEADLLYAELQGASLWYAELQGANLERAQLQGAFLGYAQLQGANLERAQLQGANLERAHIGSADFQGVNLTWSDLRRLGQWPLDKNTYEKLENILTDVLSDTGARTASLKRLHDAVGRPTNLSAAHAEERSVLCDDVTVFRFCVTLEQIAGYADDHARFLVNLGCKGTDAAIARNIMLWYHSQLDRKDPFGLAYKSLTNRKLTMAFAQHVTTRLEKDCPGWAALSADEKDSLRTLAAEENPVPE
jgi:uncharacterized protein YjbI with pentapeptide repeats